MHIFIRGVLLEQILLVRWEYHDSLLCVSVVEMLISAPHTAWFTATCICKRYSVWKMPSIRAHGESGGRTSRAGDPLEGILRPPAPCACVRRHWHPKVLFCFLVGCISCCGRPCMLRPLP